MDLVTTTMNGAEFKIKLKQEFARLYCPNETQLDTIIIYKFESTKKTANRDCHFIIEYKEKNITPNPPFMVVELAIIADIMKLLCISC